MPRGPKNERVTEFSTCLLQDHILGSDAKIHPFAGHLLQPRDVHGGQPRKGLQVAREVILAQM